MLNYLRTQFDNIRCIVPLQAKSAATMLALGGDEIVMGLHSRLGPIDPQILIPVPEGQRFAPAHAILRDFGRAKREIANDVAVLPAWTPILRGYSGGLLEFCTQQVNFSQEIVAGWLTCFATGTIGHSSRSKSPSALAPKHRTTASERMGVQSVSRSFANSRV